MHAGWEHDPTGTYLWPKSVALPIRRGAFFEQLGDWYRDAQQLCDPFRYGAVTASSYNINILWTIPLEWMGSMLVFVTVLGTARLKTWVKLGVLFYLFYWCHHTSRWEPATFLVGILLADLSFIRQKYSAKSEFSVSIPHLPKNSKLSKQLEIAGRVFWTALFIFGLDAGSHPQNSPSSTPGYQTLMSLVPSQYAANAEIFWLAIGGVIVVFALENAPHLQNLFTTPFAQYLGDISFSLYMLHTAMMLTLGTCLAPKAMNLTGGWSNGQAGFITGMVAVVAVTGPVTFWVSDVFSKAVDENCVKFTRWVSTKCFAKVP